MDVIENVIEFLKGQDVMTVTLCQRKLINKVKKYAAEYPNECQITATNKDGSIVAHMPVSWLKITPRRKMTVEQKSRLLQNFA